MRKQAKLVAVLSAAALLAVGASMTSFAATPHWDMEDGEWVYLDRNGDKVTDVWKKSNGQWYYLDEDGFMAKDKVIEDDDDKYYVGEDGARVTNAWVSMDNDDLLDDDDEINSIETVWMYFSNNGKALGSGSDHGEIKKLSYGDGQSGYFIFNEDGYMLSGWKKWTKDGADDELYYLGDQNEGWATTSWKYLPVDPDLEAFSGISEADEEYNEEEWFYFNSNGKAVLDGTKNIGGKTYIFDEYGRMLDLWVYAAGTDADSHYTNEGGSSTTWATTVNASTGVAASKSSAFYREDNGGRDKNWVLAYPKTAYDNYSDDEYWFYLDSNGRPFRAVDPDLYTEYANKLTAVGGAYRVDDDNETDTAEVDNNAEVAAKSIKNSTYLFNNHGVMLTGLYWLGGTDDGQNYDNAPVFKGTSARSMTPGYYYFTEDGDHGANEGKMVTNKKLKIDIDGDDETYYFGKDGRAYVNTIINSTVYNGKGKLETRYGDGSTYQVVDLAEIVEFRQRVTADGKRLTITQEEFDAGHWEICLTDKSGKVLVSGNVQVLMNENGKIKQSGSTTDVNDQKVTVKSYEVIKIESK